MVQLPVQRSPDSRLWSLESIAMIFIHNYFSRTSDAYRIPAMFVLISKSDHSFTKVCFLLMGQKELIYSVKYRASWVKGTPHLSKMSST